jgi:hypothetical protein
MGRPERERAVSLAELSNVLWRQRQLLDLLLFRMTVEQTLLVGRQVRWLARATDEVEAVLEEMRQTELVRSIVLQDAADELGLGVEPSLRELAEAAPAPWGEIFEEHRRAFLALTDEVQTIAAANRELLGREQRATRELLDELSGSVNRGRRASDDPHYGRASSVPAPAIVLDEAF